MEQLYFNKITNISKLFSFFSCYAVICQQKNNFQHESVDWIFNFLYAFFEVFILMEIRSFLHIATL